MVDPGETVSKTLRREFLEEVDTVKNLSEEEAERIHEKIEKFLTSMGREVSSLFCFHFYHLRWIYHNQCKAQFGQPW